VNPSARFDVAGYGAIVTGGASGLGLAYGEVLAAHGARVTRIDVDGDGDGDGHQDDEGGPDPGVLAGGKPAKGCSGHHEAVDRPESGEVGRPPGRHAAHPGSFGGRPGGQRCYGKQQEGGDMAKSSRRDRTEGVLERLGGRITELVGRFTGRKSHRAKGRVLRLRGSARSGRGRAKKRARPPRRFAR
jgi:uncharacterized protein YjbJ (UPF0337 family)